MPKQHRVHVWCIVQRADEYKKQYIETYRKAYKAKVRLKNLQQERDQSVVSLETKLAAAQRRINEVQAMHWCWLACWHAV